MIVLNRNRISIVRPVGRIYEELTDDEIERAIKVLRPGDFLFFYPTDAKSNVVCQFAGKYCHTAFYLGGSLMISAHFWKGIDFDDLYCYRRPFDAFRVKGLKKGQVDKMISFALSLRGKKYDKAHVFLLPFKNRILSYPDRYFCSEFCSVLLIRIGRIPEPPTPDPELITPEELSRQSFFQQVYSTVE